MQQRQALGAGLADGIQRGQAAGQLKLGPAAAGLTGLLIRQGGIGLL